MRTVKEDTLSASRIVGALMSESKTGITDLAKHRGVSRTTIYKNLASKEISLEVFTELVEGCGYTLAVLQNVDGKAKNIRNVRRFMREDVEL